MLRKTSVAILVLACARTGAAAPPVTIDDLMKLRSIADICISPDGNTVAYVVSTPSLAQNEHQGSLFIVPARGGSSTALAQGTRILNAPVVRSQLQWSPDSAAITFLAFD